VLITVSKNPGLVKINGFAISTAPKMEELLEVLGKATRIDSTPAPAGQRHNQIHVYDESGIYIHEHHFTRRAECLSIALDVKEPQFGYVPKYPYTGEFRLGGILMPLGRTEIEFLQVSPFRFQDMGRGSWSAEFEGFSIYFTTQGRILPSGSRSKSRHIITLSLTWPHDPTQAPESQTAEAAVAESKVPA
jgi:hypothetical protein